jgi:hypothetical protein
MDSELKLFKIPFFKHDGPEVEIAAAGNFRMADHTPGTGPFGTQFVLCETQPAVEGAWWAV